MELSEGLKLVVELQWKMIEAIQKEISQLREDVWLLKHNINPSQSSPGETPKEEKKVLSEEVPQKKQKLSPYAQGLNDLLQKKNTEVSEHDDAMWGLSDLEPLSDEAGGA